MVTAVALDQLDPLGVFIVLKRIFTVDMKAGDANVHNVTLQA